MIFSEMTKNKLWDYLVDNDIVDIGQVSARQKEWLENWIKKDLVIKYKSFRFPAPKSAYHRWTNENKTDVIWICH